MLILEHMKQLVDACHPASREEALKLWHDIKPVRRAEAHTWTVAGEYSIFSFGVPDDSAYLVIMRVEGYIHTNVPTAAGFGLKTPLPATASVTTGNARWVASPVFPAPPNEANITGFDQNHVFIDVDEFLFIKAGTRIQLIADLPANPTADARFIRTIVYAYLLGPAIADKIGAGEAQILSGFTT